MRDLAGVVPGRERGCARLTGKATGVGGAAENGGPSGPNRSAQGLEPGNQVCSKKEQHNDHKHDC